MRYALLIGNQTYDPSVGALRNPHNDISIVSEALKKQNFEVLPLVENADRTVILGAVRDLAQRLKSAGIGAIGFIYYSGHGVAEENTNVNYLIPIDVKEPGSQAFWDKSLKLDDIIQLLDLAQHAVKFVVFDACRTELQMPTRDVTKGLLPVAEQRGFFIAYSTAPGRSATDHGEGSGPYAAALAAELAHPGLDQLNLFQNVKESVISSTGGMQQPWESNGLTRRVYLTGEPTTPADLALWESVRTTDDPLALKSYLEHFPDGVFARTAKQMMDRLNAEAAQRHAAEQLEKERKERESAQAEQLRRAIDDAQKARQELSLAQANRVRADAEAEQARAAVAAALADRDTIAAREMQLRQAQVDLVAQQSRASTQTAAEFDAAKADLQSKLKMATAGLQTARDALSVAEAKQAASELAAQQAHLANTNATAVLDAPAVAGESQVAVLTVPHKIPPSSSTSKLSEGEAGEKALGLSESANAKIQAVLIKRGLKIGFPGGTFGRDTREAIAVFQKSLGHKDTGFLTAEERDLLIAEFRKAGPSAFPIALPLEPEDLGPNPDAQLVEAVSQLQGRPIRYARFGNRTFIAVQQFEVTWQRARDEAKAAGGDLASLDAPGLIATVTNLFAADSRFGDYGDDGTKDGPWIGLVRDPSAQPPKAGWHWLSGTRLATGNWAEGQPNFGTGRDNCGHFMSPGKLNRKADQRANKLDDMACDHVMKGYVMELTTISTVSPAASRP